MVKNRAPWHAAWVLITQPLHLLDKLASFQKSLHLSFLTGEMRVMIVAPTAHGCWEVTEVIHKKPLEQFHVQLSPIKG